MMWFSSLISIVTVMLYFSELGTSKNQQTSASSSGKGMYVNVDNTVHRQLSSANCRWETTTASNPPVYWINLATNTARKQYMTTQLAAFGFHKQQRIEAITPNSTTYKLLKLQKPCKRNTDRDIAVIMSHLTAIHTAIYDTTPNGLNSDYALILEDDVKLLFHLNFTALIASAPRDFGILQLVTSNEEAIQGLWATYKQQTNDVTSDWTKRLWTRNLWTTMTRDKRFPLYWSAQAYLINKKAVKPFVDDVIVSTPASSTSTSASASTSTSTPTTTSAPSLSFKIINSFFPKECKRTRENPCILANCLFSDSYIYSGGGPTYVSHIPLFTGASIGLASSIHQDQVPVHKSAFDRIDVIVKKMRHRHRPLSSEDSKKSGASNSPTSPSSSSTEELKKSQTGGGSSSNRTIVHASIASFPPYLIDPSGCIPMVVADDLPYKAIKTL